MLNVNGRGAFFKSWDTYIIHGENEIFCVKWGPNEDYFSSLVLMRTKSSIKDHFATTAYEYDDHTWENEIFCVKWGPNEDYFSSLVLMRTKSSIKDHFVTTAYEYDDHVMWWLNDHHHIILYCWCKVWSAGRMRILNLTLKLWSGGDQFRVTNKVPNSGPGPKKSCAIFWQISLTPYKFYHIFETLLPFMLPKGLNN